ncbi:MAG: DNA-directed RNA polymerase [Parcubacteria group bacterium GW2011_GWC2_44_17]|nr:MAG: DNA-directed RNA polymerase [Parcubacteria group bacterium GW2011_GWC2_44_17]KKT50172.1 MAG: DNA-directed RNA polymerase [Parcubacteria group bacterium GW2011_GWF2_44_17]HCA67564.1 DNA-directed RNA polymerase subunit beta' [Candidatus Jacksonbacteria bacterium]HCE87127.1 DNA-directed RNA polymerase subunit beta' [Candidatus Jacksonbacteria bacterium]
MPTPSTTKTTIFSHLETLKTPDFDAIRLKLASPETIRSWSYGEVTKPETINYRTQKPEMEGLFCERIFGPSKDWECYCGKYKRVRYKGVVCDKCGVEVTRSLVRRERMGHVELAAPVSHIWFARGVPSITAIILGITSGELEKVLYFANFIVTSVDEKLKAESLKEVEDEYRSKRKSLEKQAGGRVREVEVESRKKGLDARNVLKHVKAVELQEGEKLKELEDEYATAKKELTNLKPLKILSELEYQDLALKYGHVFTAGIGADAIQELLSKVNLGAEIKILLAKKQKDGVGAPIKIDRRLRILSAFYNNRLRSEWMIMNVIPVIPPDLRPMVQLDGGRFAASDLNDLYRRVINRNNRLKRLKELGAPEVIQRNEKRMLQEAVDALIDNSARRGKTVTASTGQKRILKSIADMLKGKQGRFRKNLLGKRVDYSGRSVIVVGPRLKLHQCGLPKIMALELFRPFVISKLISREVVHNVRSANRFIETGDPAVWDVLDEIITDAHVLLNRAPTLHRLGIQAFNPILIEGKAIQLHPLVCAAFNADFDGDQMAVHVPLTEQAKWEAKNIMLASKNLLKPATGDPITVPSKDMVLGCYYLTTLQNEKDEAKDLRHTFLNQESALSAHQYSQIGFHDKIRVRINDKFCDTSVGRIIFNSFLPNELQFINEQMDNSKLKRLVGVALQSCGRERTAEFLDTLMQGSFKYLTRSGLTWAMADLPPLPEREQIFEEAQREVDTVSKQYTMGLLSLEEKHAKIIEIWASVKDRITDLAKIVLSRDTLNPVYSMIQSGARGSWGQTTQMMGTKGLVTSPSGETIELPVKANFREGFDVLEYFISTHGTRKGLTDTALRTANAGYLTRRLIDVAQDIVVTEQDCGARKGHLIKPMGGVMSREMWKRALGRVTLEDVNDKNGNVIIPRDTIIDEEKAAIIRDSDVEEIVIRSVSKCIAFEGICQKCYGWDLSYNTLVERGTAVGIIAAQSIGEPGTQLTMRTFHTGGVVGEDITQGLPRVEELFEARGIKKPAVLAPFDGKALVSEDEKEGGAIVEILSSDEKNKKMFIIPKTTALVVQDRDLVFKGQPLTDGALDLKELYRLRGEEAVREYIVSEIQQIYASQGQDLNDKHLEIIMRQMFSRATITKPGDTSLIVGEVMEATEIERTNRGLQKGKVAAEYERVFLGMTKASLNTSSFLSAASFQQTSQILIKAAITGQVDRLRGLKENVIIGRLIPAGTGFRKTFAEPKAE